MRIMSVDQTVREVISTMSLEERKAIYDVLCCVQNRSTNYKAAIAVTKMPKEKQMVAYWIIGNAALAQKATDKAIAEVKELLKNE